MFFERARHIGLMERLRRLFGGNPPRVQAAALPWRLEKGRVEVLLITSRGTGRWVLPKGWPEGGESLAGTAAREAREEAGVEGRMADREIGRYFYGKETESGLTWRCEVAVFPLCVEEEAKRWPEKSQRTRRWMSQEEASKAVQEPDLAQLLAAFSPNPREIAA
ncbi:NUDIX hydrolase [Chelativorans intermedius]|uniref:NUDIX hydrolase n=1 Tax=Chelativorans intermedius TaxID=515947 RepID=A0ABV6D311_9HYPH|nr:NUDIX hydrolase [Chelativorans intermedius]MCT8998505.1 NUDIX hydrolase [Chelativorans intermedius]